MARDKSTEKLQILQHFGKNVREHLRLKGLRDADLARGIGESPGNVSRWLGGTVIPNAVSIVEIADYLNASLDELYERSPPGADPRPQIRKHAQTILRLAGGAAEPKAKKKKSKATKAAKKTRSTKRKKTAKKPG